MECTILFFSIILLSRSKGSHVLRKDLENEMRFFIHKETLPKQKNNNEVDIPPKETHEKKKKKAKKQLSWVSDLVG